jgi:hypothetical protein
MERRLRKIAGTDRSEGINSCPTVLELGDDVILQGYELDAETRQELSIPDGENAVRMPKELYLRGARTLTEGG